LHLFRHEPSIVRLRSEQWLMVANGGLHMCEKNAILGEGGNQILLFSRLAW
jgi:hypothetical protein